MHVDDLGEACVFALEYWDPDAPDAPHDDAGQPLPFLNVGTGVDLTIRELADKVAAAINYKGDIEWDETKPDGTPRKQLYTGRLKELGWEPRISLDVGLGETFKIFREDLRGKRIREGGN